MTFETLLPCDLPDDTTSDLGGSSRSSTNGDNKCQLNDNLIRSTSSASSTSDYSSGSSQHTGAQLRHVAHGRRTEAWIDGWPDIAHFKTVSLKAINDAMVWLIYTIHMHGACFASIVLNWTLKKIFPPTQSDHTVQLLQVVGRHKLDVMRLAATRDFITIFRKWIKIEELIEDRRWMLYTIAKDQATFVRMPNEESHYQAKQAAFLYIDHYNRAEQVAVVPLQEFIDFSLNQIGEPKGKVLMMINSGRAGTTLLAQLLQIDGVTMSFSEPDPLFGVGNLVQEQTFGADIDNYVPLMKAVMNASCKNQTADLTYVFKPRCFSNAMLPLIGAALPYVKQMFLYRVDTNAAVRSMVRSFMSRPVLAGLYEWKKIGVGLLDRLWITGSCIEKPALRAVKPQSLWEYGAVILAVQYTYLLDTHASDENVLKMTYEELMADPSTAMTRIYDLMGWSHTHIASSLDCLAHDSQAASPLSRKRLAVHDAADLPVTVGRARKIAHILRLPRDFLMPGNMFYHEEHLRTAVE